MSEAANTADRRSPAQIEADIRRRRERLADTLEEIGARVHPRTIAEDARARMVAGVDQSLGRVQEEAGRLVANVRAQFVSEKGAPRLERIVPVALMVVGVVGLLAMGRRRR